MSERLVRWFCSRVWAKARESLVDLRICLCISGGHLLRIVDMRETSHNECGMKISSEGTSHGSVGASERSNPRPPLPKSTKAAQPRQRPSRFVRPGVLAQLVSVQKNEHNDQVD